MEIGAIPGLRSAATGELRPAPDPSGVFRLEFEKHRDDSADTFEQNAQGEEEQKEQPQPEEPQQPEISVSMDDSAAPGSLSVFA